MLRRRPQPDARGSTASPGKASAFDRCFCTNGICAPSRAVILTGKHSHLNGVRDNAAAVRRGPDDLPEAPAGRRLRNGPCSANGTSESEPTGFDHWAILPDQGDYYNPDLIEMGQTSRRRGYVTDILTDMAAAFLEARRDSGQARSSSCSSTRPRTATGSRPNGTAPLRRRGLPGAADALRRLRDALAGRRSSRR